MLLTRDRTLYNYIMSRVVVIRMSATLADRPPSADQYGHLLRIGLARLFDNDDITVPLHKMFPSGAVGLKTNCVAHKFNSTPVALSHAIGDLLEAAGTAANDVLVWDRTSRELKQAGYELNASSFGRRCLGTEACPGQYGRQFFSSGEVSSLVSNIVTDTVAHLIDVPVLKDHSLAGVSGALKNMYGAINNPNKYHDSNCDPFAAHICNLEPIRSRLRLTVMDAMRVQYHNGPGYDAEFVHPYGGLVISRDLVAADAVGLQILEHLRHEHGLPDLLTAGRPAKHIASAAALGLGIADPEQIDLKVLVENGDGDFGSGELF